MKYLHTLIFVLVTSFSFGQIWEDVGGGLSNSTHGLLEWNNQLVVLGSFNNNPCDRVALWDGTSYSCLLGGVGIVARAGVVWDGKLVVVGDFWNNFQPCVGCNGVAVWDGVSWSPLGNGVNNDVLTCTVWNNQLVIGGDFTEADGVPIARIAKWNGTEWESVGPIGSFDNDIRCMTEFEGELWVGGDFNNVGGNSPSDGVVKYDPQTGGWTGGNSGVDLVGGVNESVRVLYVNPTDGNLYMGGEFPELIDGDAGVQDFDMSGIAMYDGSNWTSLGTGLNEYCRAIHEYNGNIIAGGYFTDAGGVAANKIAEWDGTSWSAMGQGFDGIGVDEYVKAATEWNGIFFAGGAYTQAEGGPMNYIAQWYEAPTNAPTAWMTTSSTTLCGSGCIDFLDNSTNAPTSWTWTFPGSNTPTSTAQNPGSVCWSSPGTYTVSLQACNSIGCNTQDIDIDVDNGATVTVNDASICGGGPETLTAVPSSSGGSFLWSPGSETTASITVNPATSTTYTVTYSFLGCSSSATSTVTVGSGPNVAISGGNAICEGESITLTATPDAAGGTYLWSPGGQTTETITVSPTTNTDYTVEYTLNGCASPPETQSVTVTAIPTVTVANQDMCAGSSATLTAIPSSGGGSYLWSSGGQTSASITESPATTTMYSVVYTLNGCSSPTEFATISVTSPDVSVNNPSICENQSATLTATPGTSGGTFLWSEGGQTSQSIVVSPSNSTNYTVEYTLNGCTSSAETASVTVTPTPTISVSNETICSGESVVLTATPSTSGGNYLWQTTSETTQSITVAPNSTTTYDVSYMINGCSSALESSTVIVNQPYNSTENVTACIGSVVVYPDGTSVTVTANTSHTSAFTTTEGCDSLITTNVTAQSTFSTSETIDICSGTDFMYPDGTFSSNIVSNESHTSMLTSSFGCDSSVTTSLIVLALPDLTVSEVNNTLSANQNNAMYQWIDCNGNTPIQGETNQSYMPSTNGSYAVQITNNGCTDTTACTTISTIGLDENSAKTLVIYPNPVKDILTLESTNPIEGIAYEIWDAQGKIVQKGRLNSNGTIGVSDLLPGTYLLSIENELLEFIRFN